MDLNGFNTANSYSTGENAMAKAGHLVYFAKYDGNGNWNYDGCYSESYTSLRVAKEIIEEYRNEPNYAVIVSHNGKTTVYYRGKRRKAPLTEIVMA